MHYSNDTPRIERKGTRKNTHILFLDEGRKEEEVTRLCADYLFRERNSSFQGCEV